MNSMENPKVQFRFLCGLLLVVWAYCFGASVVFPPFLGYYTFDETFIADSGVFLWYGKTPRILDWPASPSVLLYGGIFGISAAVTVLQQLGAITGIMDVFNLIDQTAYQYLVDREPYILIGRALQMVVVAVLLLATLRFLFRQEHPLLTPFSRFLIGLLLVSSHLFWNGGVVLRPEGLSGSIFLYLLCRLVFSERLSPGGAVWLAALYGVVIAERLLFLFLAPMVFLGIFWLVREQKGRTLGYAVGVFLLTFVAFCPFILTDPLIVAKAFLGGIFAKVNDNPMEAFFNWGFIRSHFENPVNYLALAGCGIGAWHLVRLKKPFYTVLVVNWLLFVVLVLRSSKIYDPHLLPAALIGLVVTGIGLWQVSRWLPKGRPLVPFVFAGLMVLSELVVVVRYHSWVREDRNISNAFHWIQTLPADTRLLIPIDLGIYLPKNDACLEREMVANRSLEKKLGKLNFLMGSTQVAASDLPLSAQAFAFEDEELFDVQYRLQLKFGQHASHPRYDYDIYLDNSVLVYHAIPFSDGLQNFRMGAYDYLVTNESLEGLTPVREFSDASGNAVNVYKYDEQGPVRQDE